MENKCEVLYFSQSLIWRNFFCDEWLNDFQMYKEQTASLDYVAKQGEASDSFKK